MYVMSRKSDITGIGTGETIVQIDVFPVARTIGMLHGTRSKVWGVMFLVAARILSVRTLNCAWAVMVHIWLQVTQRKKT